MKKNSENNKTFGSGVSLRMRDRIKNRFRTNTFMAKQPQKTKKRKLNLPRMRELSLSSMLPNMITIGALCCGTTAVRMAIMNRFDMAIVCIILAAVLDALDGRVARLLKSSSKFGAELDSFSDLLSFGLAPSLIIYLYVLNTWKEVGWAICLFFVVCTTLRLARFNTHTVDGTPPTWMEGFFTGMPSPFGAYIALLPLIMQQALASLSGLNLQPELEAGFNILHTPYTYAVFLILSGVLMISYIPTFSLKKMKISQKHVLPLMLTVFLTLAMLYSEPWSTLTLIGFAYLGSIPFSIKKCRKLKREFLENPPPA